MNEDWQVISPHAKDLGGGFMVRRLLPSSLRQAVGPFLFFDHFGPVEARPGDNHDVRPHPHIGLATVTYLYEGAMVHRDSTGVEQRIEPGAINWMTAGRGIVHSERAPDDLRRVPHRTHGLQLWAALPAEHEEDAPSFSHTPATAIPQIERGGVTLRVLIGEAQGARSPVRTLSATLYLDFLLKPAGSIELPTEAQERALYGVDTDFELDGVPVPAYSMLVLEPGRGHRLSAPQGARVAMIGGAPLGHRHMNWNFVSSRSERIADAQDDWDGYAARIGSAAPSATTRFPPVPGETEFIPLPPRRP